MKLSGSPPEDEDLAAASDEFGLRVSSHTSARVLLPPRFIGDAERGPEPQGKQEQNKQAGLHEDILLAEASSDCLEDILRL